MLACHIHLQHINVPQIQLVRDVKCIELLNPAPFPI